MTTEQSVAELNAREAAASASVEAREVQERAANFVITTPAEASAASLELNAIQRRWNEVEALRKRLKAPILESAANVDREFAEPLGQLESAKKLLNGSLSVYETEQRRIAAEQRRAAEEVAAAERRRLEQLAARAEKKGDVVRADALAYQAATVPVVSAPSPPKTEGIASVETWKAEITDMGALLAWIGESPRERGGYVTVNQSALNAMARAQKTTLHIPGVRAVSERSVRATGRR